MSNAVLCESEACCLLILHDSLLFSGRVYIVALERTSRGRQCACSRPVGPSCRHFATGQVSSTDEDEDEENRSHWKPSPSSKGRTTGDAKTGNGPLILIFV